MTFLDGISKLEYVDNNSAKASRLTICIKPIIILVLPTEERAQPLCSQPWELLSWGGGGIFVILVGNQIGGEKSSLKH